MSKRTESLARTLEDLSKAAPGLHDAVARVQDQRRGLVGAASYDPDAGPGGSGGPSSPVERALNLTGGNEESDANWKHPVDGARKAISEVDKILRRMEADSLALLRFVQSNTPHAASPKDKATVDKANAEATDCEHCTKAGIYEPAAHTGTVSGNLPHPMRLCSGCYRDVYRSCRLPKAETCLFRHERGKDPMVKVEA